MSQSGLPVHYGIPEQKGAGEPWWCHHHSFKMNRGAFDPTARSLVIEGSAASLSIELIQPDSEDDPYRWHVAWQIQHSSDASVSGRSVWTDALFAAAFGLADTEFRYGQLLIDRYGADTADQGHFIRWRRYLNVPDPGVGHDGDPNISIELDSDMMDAVRQLLGLPQNEEFDARVARVLRRGGPWGS